MPQQLKAWLIEEAQRTGLAPHTIWCRVADGKYPSLKMARASTRIIFVLNKPRSIVEPRPGEIRFAEWVRREAQRLGLKPGAIFERFYRGDYPQLKRRCPTRGTVFVQL